MVNYGPRLTDEQYDKSLVDLHKDLPPVISQKLQQQISQQELNLAIDYRLGLGFPSQKREAMWSVKQRVERRLLWMMTKYLLRRFFAKSLVRDARGFAGYLVDAYRKVLTDEELKQFFGEDADNPTLPVELDQLK